MNLVVANEACNRPIDTRRVSERSSCAEAFPFRKRAAIHPSPINPSRHTDLGQGAVGNLCHTNM